MLTGIMQINHELQWFPFHNKVVLTKRVLLHRVNNKDLLQVELHAELAIQNRHSKEDPDNVHMGMSMMHSSIVKKLVYERRQGKTLPSIKCTLGQYSKFITLSPLPLDLPWCSR